MDATVSSPQEYEMPTISLQSQDPLAAVLAPDRYEGYIPSIDAQHDYQILEQISQNSSSDDEGNENGQDEDEEEGDQQHIYQTLEQQQGGEQKGEESETQNLYQSLKENTKAATHHYQSNANTLRARGGEASATAASGRNGDDAAGYASVVTTNTHSLNGIRGRGGVQSANHKTEIPMQFLPPSHHHPLTTTASDNETTAKTSKKQRIFKILVVVCGILMVFIAVIISIVALVLVLINSPSNTTCQCPSAQNIQEQFLDLSSRIGKNSDEFQSLSGYLDAVNNAAVASSAKNEEEIAAQAEVLDRVKETARRLDTAVRRNVSTLVGVVDRLSAVIENVTNLLNCTTSVEATCTFYSTCHTDDVEYQKAGKLTVNFNCLITRPNPGSLYPATAVMRRQNGTVACQCTNIPLEDMELPLRECGISVTRCTIP